MKTCRQHYVPCSEIVSREELSFEILKPVFWDLDSFIQLEVCSCTLRTIEATLKEVISQTRHMIKAFPTAVFAAYNGNHVFNIVLYKNFSAQAASFFECFPRVMG
jgi:hypothetical protein